MSVNHQGIQGQREFPTTRSSVIVRAQDPRGPEARKNLDRLVKLYWKPVYCVIRHAWSRSHDDAKDLTQEFFAKVVFDRDLLRAYAPERGSFRALLRTALARFLHDVHRGAMRIKRGGGAPVLSLDIGDFEPEGIDRSQQANPEQLFSTAWREVAMQEALRRLEAQYLESGRGAELEIFCAYDLAAQDPAPSYADLAKQHNLTVPQIKHSLLRTRAALREAITDIARDYVDDPAELADELRFLLEL